VQRNQHAQHAARDALDPTEIQQHPTVPCFDQVVKLQAQRPDYIWIDEALGVHKPHDRKPVDDPDV
jgi:hypothetical protein